MRTQDGFLQFLRVPWPGRSLGMRPKMFIFFGLPFVAIVIVLKSVELFGLPLTGFEGEISDLRAEAFKDLNLVADLKEERLGRWLEELRADTTIVAGGEDFRRDVQEVLLAIQHADSSGASVTDPSKDPLKEDEAYLESTRSLHSYLMLIIDTYGVYDRIEIADARTGMIVVSTDETAVGSKAGGEEHFPGILEPGVSGDYFHFVEHRQPTSGQPSRPAFIISRLITGPDPDGTGGGEATGVLIMGVNLDDIIGPILFTGDGLGRTGEALLVDNDVRILTSLAHPLADGSVAEPLRYQITAEPARNAAGGQSGIMSSKDYRGVQVLAAYRYIPITPEMGWGLVVKQDNSEVFGALRQSVTHTVWIGITGAVLVLVLAFVVATGLARPIRALENAVTRFGRGDRTARVAENSSGEIGRLAHEFNTMAASLTQREKEIEQRSFQLEAANKELAAFSFSVSHDLRSPLRTIDGFARILEQDHGPELSDEARRYLRLVRGGAQQMGILIDDLLEFSHLGQRPIKKQQIDPTPVVRRALSDLRAEQEDRSVEIAIGQLPECDADPAMLRQVYTNLLSNSLKFSRTRNPAVIEIGAISENGSTVYFVRDNGVGFDIKYAEKLFGVFQRLHRAEEFEGTGVGTAIARRIVHRHGGTIWAEAQVDKGATFFFTLSTGVTSGS